MEQPVPKIKFCGLTDGDDAEAAVAAGAWALGFILWPGSRRFAPIGLVAEVAAVHRRQVEIVGVFVNPTLEQVTRAAEEGGLTMLQMHGDEGPAFCAEVARRTGCRVIKAARVRSGADIQALQTFHTDFHLLDSFVPGSRGGTGETFAWDLARSHRRRTPLILSGGLHPGSMHPLRPLRRPVRAGDADAGARRARAAWRRPAADPAFRPSWRCSCATTWAAPRRCT
jgi:phosphoribosylanthranilate isomerase